jgi:murein DD-endopeptidase MepM/ murein hydrolase activator NlpD
MAVRLLTRSRGAARLAQAARSRTLRVGGVLAASVALVVAGTVNAPSAAWADQYPTWGDVQAAKASEASAQAEVNQVTALIQNLQTRSQQAQAAATAAGTKLASAQDALFVADQKYQGLKGQADTLTAQADTASTRAGRVAAQLYRSGGHNMTVSLLFASTKGSESDPTDLLDNLGTMTKLTESTSDLWAQAQQAKNTAQAASAQAKSALDERTRLQQQAQAALASAQQASAAAQQAVTDEQAHSDELNTMLAALTDKTNQTVAGYQAGVEARAAAARAAAAAAAAAAAQQAAAQAGKVGSQGWAVPVKGPIASPFGARPAPCAGCTTWHEGDDIAAPTGTPIHAAHAGTVLYAGVYGDYGNFVLLDNGGGIDTAYGHIVNGGFAVSTGQHVEAGQVIAHVGSTGHSTGPHLHFEVRQNGVQINPVPWMAQHGAPL